MASYRSVFPLAMVALLSFALASCGPSREELKKQAEDSRTIGEAYLRAGNSTTALKEFLKAEAKYPDDYILQNDLGLVYLQKNRTDLAITHFQRAVELKPDYAPGKNNLGYAYLQNKQYDKAIAVFKDVIEDLLYATPHRPLSGLGAAYYYKGQYREAEKYYLKALKIYPRHPPALWGLGRTQLTTGKVTDAIGSLEKAVQAAPNFTEAWFNLGQAYADDHQDAKAIIAFEQVQTLAPDSPLAASAEAELTALGR